MAGASITINMCNYFDTPNGQELLNELVRKKEAAEKKKQIEENHKQQEFLYALDFADVDVLAWFFEHEPKRFFALPEETRKPFIELLLSANPYVFPKLSVEEKTLEICLYAIDKYVWNFESVPSQFLTDAFIKNQIKKCWLLIQSVKNPTEELCLLAIQKCPDAIFHIQNKTEKLLTAAAKAHGLYKKSLNPEIPQYYNAVLACVRESGQTLQYVNRELKTYEMCKAAVENYPKAIKYVNAEMKKAHPDLISLSQSK